jgi:hypothetical protein
LASSERDEIPVKDIDLAYAGSFIEYAQLIAPLQPGARDQNDMLLGALLLILLMVVVMSVMGGALSRL